LAYTNHTLLPEALEINRRFVDRARARFPGEDERIARMGLIEEDGGRRIRMANLAIIGSHSTNEVAAIHSELLRRLTVQDLAEMFPERFNNKTNGVTPRRWLLLVNPSLAGAIIDAIGDGWVTDFAQLAKLRSHADDAAFREAFHNAKREAKARFADWLKSTSGQSVEATPCLTGSVSLVGILPGLL
jgi:starch phosphorylase